jgi:23S rRNA pseudoU1915 N3-methylase RlmH
MGTREGGLRDADSDSEYESLNMQEVAVALDAAVNDTSDENLCRLLKEVDFDVLTLANMARSHRNTHNATTLLLSAAVMISEEKARQAESKATDAESKATEAESTATQAHHRAIEAQNTNNFLIGLNNETASDLCGQGEQIAQIMRRLAALEAVRSTPLSSPAHTGEDNQTAALERALAATNARLEAAEKEVDKYRMVVERAMLPFDKENPFDDLAARMQVLADLREQATSDEFERRDYARQREVEKFRAQNALLRQENAATKVALDEVLFQFRRTRTYMIAHIDGDLNSEEVCFFHLVVLTLALANSWLEQLKERLRGLELSGGASA